MIQLTLTLPHRLSKRQSLSTTTTILFRTTFTRTFKLSLLLKWLLGSNLSQFYQRCWGHPCSLRMDYKDLWVVFFPRCTAGAKLVGSCCIRLHTTANTHATTANTVGATKLGVVAPVCTQPNIYEGVIDASVNICCKLKLVFLEKLWNTLTYFSVFLFSGRQYFEMGSL